MKLTKPMENLTEPVADGTNPTANLKKSVVDLRDPLEGSQRLSGGTNKASGRSYKHERGHQGTNSVSHTVLKNKL
jgi:hypothetical protein